MLSLIFNNPIFTMTVIILTLIFVGVIKQYSPGFGEILGMNVVWPFVAFTIAILLKSIIVIGKLFFRSETKMKPIKKSKKGG